MLLCLHPVHTENPDIIESSSLYHLNLIISLKPYWQFCFHYLVFLPRCMECRRGLAMRILSVCLSVCPSVTRVYCDKMVENLSRFLYHTREHLA